MQTRSVVGILLMALMTLGQVTAFAQDATPAATPAGDIPNVTATREVTFEGQYLSMSPDGKWIATFDPEDDLLCALDAASLSQEVATPESEASRSCVSFDSYGIHSIAEENVRWSPDSSRLAFTENGAIFLVDADIWVFTPETGDVVNLTDDGVEGSLMIFRDDQRESLTMDLLPVWSPDGEQIAFARSPWNGDWRGTQLMLVPADGSGEADVIGEVAVDMPMIVYFGMGFSPDGGTLYFTRAKTDPDDSNNGVWEISLDTYAFRHIAKRTDPERGYPTLASVSPKGDQLLLYDALFAGQFGPIDSPYALLDTESDDVEPLIASSPDEPLALVPVRVAYSPDGEWLVYSGTGTSTASGLFLRPSSESGPGQDQLLFDNPNGEFQFSGVSWGSNGTIFAQTSPQSGLIFDISGGNQPPQISPAAADATPPASASAVVSGPVDPATVETGTELMTNDAVVALRSAPSTDAPVVAELSVGTTLVALGPVEDVAGFSWIPVREPDSGTIGYVRAELVSIAEA